MTAAEDHNSHNNVSSCEPDAMAKATPQSESKVYPTDEEDITITAAAAAAIEAQDATPRSRGGMLEITIVADDSEHNNSNNRSCITTTTTTLTNSSSNSSARSASVSPERSTPAPTDNPAASARQQQQQQRKSLAWSKSTSWCAFFWVPVLILVTHGLFYYGQTANMWRLSTEWQADVSYTAVNKESQALFHLLQLPLHDNYTHLLERKDLRHYTYKTAIHDLWLAKGMPGKLVPRLCALGLVLFSGVWPHLKLGMLLLTWWFSRQPVRRRRILDTLSILGKWSLVDVVVVCILLGVVHLEWNFTGPDVYQGVLDNWASLVTLVRMQYGATELCARLLHYDDCKHPSILDHMVKCKTCVATINGVYNNPETAKPILHGIEVEGGGHAQLSVAGLSGIYSFCGAVLLSIVLSLVVDWFDHKSRWYTEAEEERQQAEEDETNWEQADAPEVSGTLAATDSEEGLHEPLLSTPPRRRRHGRRGLESRSQADLDFDRQILIQEQQRTHCLWQCAAMVTLVACTAATLQVTLERRVHGALPEMVHRILGVVWTRQYSFWGLAWTTGSAGGWDWMLMGTFAWFIVLGPIVRAILVVVASRVYETPHMTAEAAERVRRRQVNLALAVDFVGSFCAWEVYTMALIMFGLLLPGITGTIINDPRCALLFEDTDKCLEVEQSMKGTAFLLVVVSGLMLLAVSHRIRHAKPPSVV